MTDDQARAFYDAWRADQQAHTQRDQDAARARAALAAQAREGAAA